MTNWKKQMRSKIDWKSTPSKNLLCLHLHLADILSKQLVYLRSTLKVELQLGKLVSLQRAH